jgi:hypothetical protein
MSGHFSRSYLRPPWLNRVRREKRGDMDAEVSVLNSVMADQGTSRSTRGGLSGGRPDQFEVLDTKYNEVVRVIDDGPEFKGVLFFKRVEPFSQDNPSLTVLSQAKENPQRRPSLCIVGEKFFTRGKQKQYCATKRDNTGGGEEKKQAKHHNEGERRIKKRGRSGAASREKAVEGGTETSGRSMIWIKYGLPLG